MKLKKLAPCVGYMVRVLLNFYGKQNINKEKFGPERTFAENWSQRSIHTQTAFLGIYFINQLTDSPTEGVIQRWLSTLRWVDDWRCFMRLFLEVFILFQKTILKNVFLGRKYPIQFVLTQFLVKIFFVETSGWKFHKHVFIYTNLRLYTALIHVYSTYR